MASTRVLPTAGVGGSLYDKPFQVPVYGASAPSNMVTWRMLDIWNNINAGYAINRGIATGLLFSTLVYLLALTPKRKRTTMFQHMMLLGVVFLLVHLLIDIVSATTPGLQLRSAYPSLTLDIVNEVWPRTFFATFAASRITAWLAFFFAYGCLWLQAKGLMTGLAVQHPHIQRCILVYLAIASVAVFAASTFDTVRRFLLVGRPVVDPIAGANTEYTIAIIVLLTNAICIGSYSLISTISVITILWGRPFVIPGESAYRSALGLIGMVTAKSLIVPCKENTSSINAVQTDTCTQCYSVQSSSSSFRTPTNSASFIQRFFFSRRSTHSCLSVRYEIVKLD
jgi:hypothetical protein